MLQNKDIETLRMLFSSHNYVMTTAELTASKLYYADIKQLLDEGLIERVRRGYYHWTQDYGESEVFIINRLFYLSSGARGPYAGLRTSVIKVNRKYSLFCSEIIA